MISFITLFVQLAMGTAKGVIIIFNKKTQKSVPVTGKHAKKIIGGAWNTKNNIAFASEDRIVRKSLCLC